ncbi:hypothetical protein F5Y14DRAFT_451380 [Nemania sp. NC0429]|nr:hypothetical protein F5Y14DRAFT_451380 [Nemania sp. NC0429]
MHLNSLLTGAGLVAMTNALMLPPDLAISGDANAGGLITTLPVPVPVDTRLDSQSMRDKETVDLECPGCFQIWPVRVNVPSHLKLDFSIESDNGADRLTLNGYELYPNPDHLRNILTAPVLPDIPKRRPGIPRLPYFRGGPKRLQKGHPLGFAMETSTEAVKDNEVLEFVKLDLQIIEVGNILMRHIPEVRVILVKNPIKGTLVIDRIDRVGYSTEAADIREDQKECSTTMCRWKALVFKKLSMLSKGCGGSSRPHHNPEGEYRHHGHGPHPAHMRHHHGWSHGVGVFVMRILFPVLIGIVAGISASLIGIMVGTFIVFLWRLFFRRSYTRSSHRCRYAHKAAKSEDAVDEEKSGLLNEVEEAEAPPAYAESDLVRAEDKKPENEA